MTEFGLGADGLVEDQDLELVHFHGHQVLVCTHFQVSSEAMQ